MSRTNHQEKKAKRVSLYGYSKELWSKRSASLGTWLSEKYYRRLSTRIERRKWRDEKSNDKNW